MYWFLNQFLSEARFPFSRLAQLLKERGHTFDLSSEWGDGWKTVARIEEQLSYVSLGLDGALAHCC
jgi:hypothetical protein